MTQYHATIEGLTFRIKQIGKGYFAFDAVTGVYVARGVNHCDLFARINRAIQH